MAVTDERMRDALEALTDRCISELKNPLSVPAWGTITAALIKHYNVPLGEKGTEAIGNLEAEEARRLRKERRASRFSSNGNVISMTDKIESTG